MKNIYIEIGKPNEYIDMMRRNGKDISVNEADSLTYTAAGLKYNANDCPAAIEGFKIIYRGFQMAPMCWRPIISAVNVITQPKTGPMH